MGWLRRILGTQAGHPETGCERMDPGSFTRYEDAVSLIPCAMRLRGARAQEFADRIDHLLFGLPSSRLSHLDRSIRDRSSWRGDWFGERRLERVLPTHLPGHEDMFLCLALCHASGYVRQAAIGKAAARLRSGPASRYAVLALQLLVLRTNDWVDAVVSTAIAVLDRLLEDGPVEGWIHALPLVDGLPALGRRDHTAFIQAVHDASRTTAWAAPLLAGVQGGDRHVARSAVAWALASPALSPGDVVNVALGASDPVVRLIAARNAGRIVGTERRLALLRRLETDDSVRIRREALRFRTGWFPDTLREAYHRLLFDRSRGLRAQAQAELGTRGEEVAEPYRRRLDAGAEQNPTLALLGLAEVGVDADADVASRYLDDPRAKIRAAALRCVARLAGDRYVEALVAALVDPSPRVCRTAAAGLRERVHQVGVDRLLAILDHPPHAHVKRVVIQLLLDDDPWAPLAPLVRCLADGDAGDGPWAADRLRLWFARNRGWSRRPPEARIAALRDALQENRSRLPGQSLRDLDFLLSVLAEA